MQLLQQSTQPSDAKQGILNTRPAVQDMLSTLQRIVDNGHGYAVDGDVFFDVESLPGYGRLSGLIPVRPSLHHAL